MQSFARKTKMNLVKLCFFWKKNVTGSFWIFNCILLLPIFEFVPFKNIFGSRIWYGVMGLWSIFSILCILGQTSFRLNVRFSMLFGYLFIRRYVLSVRCLSAICSFCHLSFGNMSIRPKVFQSYFLSVVWLSVICPFSHLYFGHLSYHHESLLREVWIDNRLCGA